MHPISIIFNISVIFLLQTCAQNSICENTVGSFRCTCKEGFKSVSDTVCEDVNECHETVGLCEHTCINSWGTYRCACRQGFEINSDNRLVHNFFFFNFI